MRFAMGLRISEDAGRNFKAPDGFPKKQGSRFPKEIKKTHRTRNPVRLSFLNAGNRNRTGTGFTPQDFKSCASASSAMPARK